MWHAALRGNGYAYINRAGGRIVELVPLDPDRVTVKQLADFSLSYSVSRSNGLDPLPLTARDVLHIRGPSKDGIVGLSLVTYAREAIGLAIATEEHGARFFSNAARPSGILARPADKKALSKEAAQSLVDSFTRMYSGQNAQRTVLLEEGTTFQPTTMKNDDMQFLETRKFQKEEICAIFRVPPHMVADLERATFSNIEQQSTEFVTYSLGPWMGRWEQAIQRDLIADRRRANSSPSSSSRGSSAATRRRATPPTARHHERLDDAERGRGGRRILNPLPGLDEPLEPVAVAQPAKSTDGSSDKNRNDSSKNNGGKP
jgi:HK97 family phage portal protein